MKRFRLTKAAKILIVILVIALLGGGVFAGLKTGLITTDKDKVNNKENSSNNVLDYDENGNVMDVDTKDDAAINLSLDEWIG